MDWFLVIYLTLITAALCWWTRKLMMEVQPKQEKQVIGLAMAAIEQTLKNSADTSRIGIQALSESAAVSTSTNQTLERLSHDMATKVVQREPVIVTTGDNGSLIPPPSPQSFEEADRQRLIQERIANEYAGGLVNPEDLAGDVT